MPNVNDVQQAVRGWQIAFSTMTEYFENNDILDPMCFDRWAQLIDVQDVAQIEVKRLVKICLLRE
ncbi:MAG: hypothetical protein WBF88_06805 [Pusillimonas sp.]